MLELLERQKRLTVNQWKIISAAILGDMLDFFDFFLIGYVLTFIVKAWHLSFMESGVILLAAGVGAIPGAFCGFAKARIGQRGMIERHRSLRQFLVELCFAVRCAAVVAHDAQHVL